MLTDERLAQITVNQRRRLKNVRLNRPIDGANISAYQDVRDMLDELERRAVQIDYLRIKVEEAEVRARRYCCGPTE